MNWTPEQVARVMAAVVALAGLVKTLWARGQVTPVNAPRDNEGRMLVPETP